MSLRTDYRVPPKITSADWNRFAENFTVGDRGITFGGILEVDRVDGVVKVGGDILPLSDASASIGSPGLRWSSIHAVNVVSGDYVFENGWRIVEAERLGLGEGLAILDGRRRVRVVLR